VRVIRMIRQPLFQLIDAYYEVFENEDSQSPVGKATVTKGLIELLQIKSDTPEAFQGQILNKLLRCIVTDADHHNSNLSIKIADPSSIRLTRFLERFGFRKTHEDIFKRTAGSVLPPSVQY
jgi:hypothetical protein